MDVVINSETGEPVDLKRLTSRLHARFIDRPPLDYVPGKTVLRDAVVDELQCSELEAERLVDTLECAGLLKYAPPPPPLDGGYWIFASPPYGAP